MKNERLPPPGPETPIIFRQVAFPLSSFDYLKEWQRIYEAKHRVRITNNQALAIIMAEHKQMNEERGVRNDNTGRKVSD